MFTGLTSLVVSAVLACSGTADMIEVTPKVVVEERTVVVEKPWEFPCTEDAGLDLNGNCVTWDDIAIEIIIERPHLIEPWGLKVVAVTGDYTP